MMNNENKMKRTIVLITVLIAVCVGVSAIAQTSAPLQEQTKEQPVNGAGEKTETVMPEQQMPLNDSYSFLKSLMALCFVLGLIFLATYAFKKITGLKTHGFGGLGRGKVPIHPVSSMPLGDKKFLSIVEIQGKHYFLGITQDSINLLAELQLEMDNEPAADTENFPSILERAKQLLNRTKKS
ncbi:MAG: flagellar biosynthetic protein FliO [Acidobacteriota bacterium]|nr:flagellar biosynthetic protein FliO [Acidobacteriota bacterium]